MFNLKVFELNFYYLIVAETEEEAIKFFSQLTDEKLERMRECNIEKEGYVKFNEQLYKLTTFKALLEDILNQQKELKHPFLLRTKPLDY